MATTSPLFPVSEQVLPEPCFPRIGSMIQRGNWVAMEIHATVPLFDCYPQDVAVLVLYVRFEGLRLVESRTIAPPEFWPNSELPAVVFNRQREIPSEESPESTAGESG